MSMDIMMSGGDLDFWGIDWAKGQWLCIGLGRDGGHDYELAKDIGEAYEKLQRRNAQIALIDVPIGLPDNADERQCDILARREVGCRTSSVFPVPCRQAVEAYRDTSGDKFAKQEAGKCISRKVARGPMSIQTWSIVPQIVEVDSFLCKNTDAQEIFREFHPEVCFYAFKGQSLCPGKKIRRKGVAERMNILLSKKEYLPRVKDIFDSVRTNHLKKEVGDDDILDAMIGALTAKLGYCGKYKTLPSNLPQDAHGLPMQMLYFANGKINQTS